jgi:DNA-binding transcriptional MerR regulator
MSTGQVAEALRVTEPQLSELIRRGRLRPAPVIVAGRRLWAQEDVGRAAALLGRSKESLEAELRATSSAALDDHSRGA